MIIGNRVFNVVFDPGYSILGSVPRVAGVLIRSLVTSGTGPEAKRGRVGCWGFFCVVSLSFWVFGRVDFCAF